eukprot:CAMPEP_0203824464 /NCGR_PEP_ID=MMETSP0115-20131106/51834_1 /ASSEMBLY_ACC=CAM_ASM_000227 /TAXON_ID=33651 /ORGANISM="Bicosoecid sp, Strain ms1" /LENGTH=115 /DNA_ID=CAMNT_0050733505 /DNA_START=201 /DNA_END=545 /DNA_ORIENTATION=-
MAAVRSRGGRRRVHGPSPYSDDAPKSAGAAGHAEGDTPTSRALRRAALLYADSGPSKKGRGKTGSKRGGGGSTSGGDRDGRGGGSKSGAGVGALNGGGSAGGLLADLGSPYDYVA